MVQYLLRRKSRRNFVTKDKQRMKSTFFFNCSKEENPRKLFFQKIKEIDKTDLNYVNKINTFKNVFYQICLKALNCWLICQRSISNKRSQSQTGSRRFYITVREVPGKLVKSISDKSLVSHKKHES